MLLIHAHWLNKCVQSVLKFKAVAEKATKYSKELCRTLYSQVTVLSEPTFAMHCDPLSTVLAPAALALFICQVIQPLFQWRRNASRSGRRGLARPLGPKLGWGSWGGNSRQPDPSPPSRGLGSAVSRIVTIHRYFENPFFLIFLSNIKNGANLPTPMQYSRTSTKSYQLSGAFPLNQILHLWRLSLAPLKIAE